MNVPTVSPPYITVRMEAADVAAAFRSGKRPLDDYFARHAVTNDQMGIGRTYVLRGDADAPAVLGFYTISMAQVVPDQVAQLLPAKPPRYPLPVALIGRLAVDERVRGRRIGERLLLDALRRIVDAADILGCVGIVVDAKDEDAERFYLKYDFKTVHDGQWPRRMFQHITLVRAALTGV